MRPGDSLTAAEALYPEHLLRAKTAREPWSEPAGAETDAWPTLAPEAYQGLAGRIVESIAPHSEADPVAILMHTLVATGNLIGRGPHALVERTVHTCGEFVALVGRTAKGRKGQAWSTPHYLLTQVDPAWSAGRVKSGLSSGEGLIYNVRDQRWSADKKGQPLLEDEGETDKRLLVVEPEFATVLRRMQGETNSLSPVLREAWETGTLSTLTKNSPLRATDAHISVIAHTTVEELVISLTETDRANGFANRFIYMLVQRSKCLPEPQCIADAVLAPFVTELRLVVDAARNARLARDEAARALWAAVYPRLSEGETGLVGAVLARAEAHVLRLSLLYAILDRSAVIGEEHLTAALAVWDYAEASARQIFGERLGVTTADIILAAVRRRGPLTRTQIRDLFQRNKHASEIDAALRMLEARGKAKRLTRSPEGGAGRSIKIWEAV
jgi:hypothetical protein